jgi:hypothetical protein
MLISPKTSQLLIDALYNVARFICRNLDTIFGRYHRF